MTKKELQTVREMTVVGVMDLLRRGSIDKSTTNQEVLNMVSYKFPVYALRLERGNLDEIAKMNCVKHICGDNRGLLKAYIRKDASGLLYEANEGDVIVPHIEGDEQSEYGIVLPSEDINNN